MGPTWVLSAPDGPHVGPMILAIGVDLPALVFTDIPVCIQMLYSSQTPNIWKIIYDVFPWWRHQMETFPRYWPFVRGIHRSPVNFPHKSQWRGVLMFSLICAWINGWVNNREAGDLRRHRAHNDVTVMLKSAIDRVLTKTIMMPKFHN